jgi:gamma-glutamylcyclotransferase (GGCT)/AIG2-like uncharacterized protein YtfP
MKNSTSEIKREIRHLPPLARKRAEKELGIARPENEHKVFVYGTLLTGERNARWARDARRVAAWTNGNIYDTGYGFPAFVKDGETKIVGELLTVNDDGFASMDRLEGYPRLYRREQIDVYTARGGRHRAWVYIMNELPKTAKLIEGGDWRNRNR